MITIKILDWIGHVFLGLTLISVVVSIGDRIENYRNNVLILDPSFWVAIFFLVTSLVFYGLSWFKRKTNRHNFCHLMIPKPMRDLRSVHRR